MAVMYVGDIHGKVEYISKINSEAIKRNIDTVIQVGDFGARWGGGQCAIFKYFDKLKYKNKKSPRWITCGGNHENWRRWYKLSEKQDNPDLVELAPSCFWARRGSVIDIDNKKHLFLGGAESTDIEWRIKDRTCWKEETPSESEFLLFQKRLKEERPDIVVTHDAPRRVSLFRKHRKIAVTPNRLEEILSSSEHSPSDWYFGHHHVLKSWSIDGVNFHCCGLHGQFKLSDD